MKTKLSTLGLAAAIILSSGLQMTAADSSVAPAREELREKLKKITPEEREARLKEVREKRGGTSHGTNDFKKMTPEEREAKMKEKRENAEKSFTGKKAHEEFQKLSTEERQAKMKEWRTKMEGVAGPLRKKKADGTLTEEESRKLTRMEETLKRMESRRPPASPQQEKPVKE